MLQGVLQTYIEMKEDIAIKQGRGLQRQLRQVESIQKELSELLDAAAVRLNLEPGSLHE